MSDRHGECDSCGRFGPLRDRLSYGTEGSFGPCCATSGPAGSISDAWSEAYGDLHHDVERLRARCAADDAEVEAYNAGHDAYLAGKPISDEPDEYPEEWLTGWIYTAWEPMQADLATANALLARQCDMARDAEVERDEARGKIVGMAENMSVARASEQAMKEEVAGMHVVLDRMRGECAEVREKALAVLCPKHDLGEIAECSCNTVHPSLAAARGLLREARDVLQDEDDVLDRVRAAFPPWVGDLCHDVDRRRRKLDALLPAPGSGEGEKYPTPDMECESCGELHMIDDDEGELAVHAGEVLCLRCWKRRYRRMTGKDLAAPPTPEPGEHLDPGTLANARTDKVHEDVGRGRAARVGEREEAPDER